MSGLLYTAMFCFGVTYVLFTIRKWVYGTKWNDAIKILVLGLSMNVLVLGAMVASMPFLDPIVRDLTLKEVPDE